MSSDFGFWIFVAAIVLGGMWKEVRQKAEKHETLRRIVDKTGTVDEAQLREIFNEKPPKDAKERKPGAGYRALRITGAVVLFIGAGMATFFLIAAGLGKLLGADGMFDDIKGFIASLAIAASIMMLGLGIFFSSRFAESPSN